MKQVDSIAGFLVERGMKGFETPRIHGKMSLRASETGEIVLDECRVPKENLLAGKRGLGAPLRCLSEARFGIAWGALGAAKACFESALSYTGERRQFGVPLSSKQLIQAELVHMASEIVKGDLLALHFGRLKEQQGKLLPEQVSLCKRNNVAVALDCARRSRALARRQWHPARVPGHPSHAELGERVHLRGHARDPHFGAGQSTHRAERVLSRHLPEKSSSFVVTRAGGATTDRRCAPPTSLPNEG